MGRAAGPGLLRSKRWSVIGVLPLIAHNRFGHQGADAGEGVGLSGRFFAARPARLGSACGAASATPTHASRLATPASYNALGALGGHSANARSSSAISGGTASRTVSHTIAASTVS